MLKYYNYLNVVIEKSREECVSETAIFSKKRQLRIFDKDGKVNKEEKILN